MPQSQSGRTAQAAPPAAEQDSRSHSPPTPALALSNLGLLLCMGMKKYNTICQICRCGWAGISKQGTVWASRQQPWELRQADLTNHRADLTATCSNTSHFTQPAKGEACTHNSMCTLVFSWCSNPIAGYGCLHLSLLRSGTVN